MNRRSSSIVAAALTAALLVVPTAGPASADATIKVMDNYFATKYRKITVGESVTWVISGADRHTITSFDGVTFDSSPETTDTCDDGNPLTNEDCYEPGQEYGPISFNQTGTFAYRCKVHGTDTVQPDPDAGAQDQPCGMCGIISVAEETQASDAPGRDPPPSVTRETPKKTKSPTASPTLSPSLDAQGSPIAAPAGGGGGAGGRVVLALLLLAALSGAGYWTWKKYLT